MTAADCPSGWSALKKLMWLVSTRSRRMPSAATIASAIDTASTRPGCAHENRATALSGARK